MEIETTTVYITTFDDSVGCRRTCDTVPWNVSAGNVSTVKSTGSPALICPMSASDTDASICILVKSSAIVNSSGV